MKKMVQITPLKNMVAETPITCARLPAKRLPKGIKPAKVSIKMLITRPRNSSGTPDCKRVLIRAMEVTPPAPIRNRAINAKKKA